MTRSRLKQNALVPASTSAWLRVGAVALGMLGRLVRMASEQTTSWQVDLGEKEEECVSCVNLRPSGRHEESFSTALPSPRRRPAPTRHSRPRVCLLGRRLPPVRGGSYLEPGTTSTQQHSQSVCLFTSAPLSVPPSSTPAPCPPSSCWGAKTFVHPSDERVYSQHWSELSL